MGEHCEVISNSCSWSIDALCRRLAVLWSHVKQIISLQIENVTNLTFQMKVLKTLTLTIMSAVNLMWAKVTTDKTQRKRSDSAQEFQQISHSAVLHSNEASGAAPPSSHAETDQTWQHTKPFSLLMHTKPNADHASEARTAYTGHTDLQRDTAWLVK